MPEEITEIGVILIAASPAGNTADFLQGLKEFGAHADADDWGAAAQTLAAMGVQQLKIDTIRDIYKKISGKRGQRLADYLGDVEAVTLMRGLAERGLVGETVQSGIKRALSRDMNPADAVVYGVLSAQTQHIRKTVLRSVLGKDGALSRALLGSLPPDKQAALIEAFNTELAAFGKEYLGDIADEVRGRMIDSVVKEIFEPDVKSPH